MLGYKEILKKLRPPVVRKPRVWLPEKEKTGYIRIRKVASSSINLSLMQHLAKGNKQADSTDDRALRKAIEARYSSHIAHAVIRRDLKGKYYLGKLETFGADWDFVSNKYGLPKPIHWNKTGTFAKLSDVCSRATMEQLIERYADDIDTFGYQQALDDLLKDY
jgi:hypothetical protein